MTWWLQRVFLEPEIVSEVLPGHPSASLREQGGCVNWDCSWWDDGSMMGEKEECN